MIAACSATTSAAGQSDTVSGHGPMAPELATTSIAGQHAFATVRSLPNSANVSVDVRGLHPTLNRDCERAVRGLSWTAATEDVAGNAKTIVVCQRASDEVVAAPPTLEPGYQLDRKAVELTRPVTSAIDREMSSLKECYESRLVDGRVLHGEVSAHFSVNTDGSCEMIGMEAGSTNDEALMGCVAALLRRLVVEPAPQEKSQFVYPFTFMQAGVKYLPVRSETKIRAGAEAQANIPAQPDQGEVEPEEAVTPDVDFRPGKLPEQDD